MKSHTCNLHVTIVCRVILVQVIELHGEEWCKKAQDDARVTDMQKFDQFMVSVVTWERKNKRNMRKTDAGSPSLSTWNTETTEAKHRQNIDGSVGKKVTASFKDSAVRVERVLWHIWTVDVFFQYNKDPPKVDGIPIKPSLHQIDEGVYVEGYALPVNYYPPPLSGVTHKVLKTFTQGDKLDWERQRSDCETYAGQTELDYRRLAQNQHRDTAVAEEAVDKPTKKQFVHPRVLSNTTNCTKIETTTPYEVCEEPQSEETADHGWMNMFRSRRSDTYTDVDQTPHVAKNGREALKPTPKQML